MKNKINNDKLNYFINKKKMKKLYKELMIIMNKHMFIHYNHYSH
jgi:hypothetical protein